jgi:HAD superfamily hydrolase (TIGR01509 family)
MNHAPDDNPLKAPVRCVLFDFDGVIVNSLPVHLAAWVSAAKDLFGLELKSPESLVGHSTTAIASSIAKELGNPGQARELMLLKHQKIISGELEVPLLPGIKTFFSVLRSHKIPFAIGSNAPRPFIEKVVGWHQLEVDIILGRDDVPRPKPHPDLYMKCAKLLGISIGDQRKTIIFEDSKHGLKAAKAAKMIPIGVATQHSQEALLKSHAAFTCDHLLDALENGVKDKSGGMIPLLFE